MVISPRRARAGPLRPVPHRRQELDDPPHGPAAGPGAGADAGASSCRCSRARARCRPTRPAWAFEVKWDGVRAIGFCSGRAAEARCSRSGRDITRAYPEVRGLAEALGAREAILDGEIVAFGDDGLPSFQRLQRRMHLGLATARSRRLARDARRLRALRPAVARRPLADGAALRGAPRARCPSSSCTGPSWQVPGHHVGDGDALLELTRRQGLEGVMAKRLDCPYVPGPPAAGWVKVKNVRRTSLVIGGWLPGEGGRSGRLGALCVGFYEDGELRYAGRVGHGLQRGRAHAPAAAARAARRASAHPFAGRQPPKATHAGSSRRSCATSSSASGRGRARCARPSYKGLRDDLSPSRRRSNPSEEEVDEAVGDVRGAQRACPGRTRSACG